MTNRRTLLASILWLRNHYDCDLTHKDLKLKREVLSRVDDLLAANETITIDDMRIFRLAFPYRDHHREAKQEAKVEVIPPNWPPPRTPEQQERVDALFSGQRTKPPPDVDHDTWENEGGAAK